MMLGLMNFKLQRMGKKNGKFGVNIKGLSHYTKMTGYKNELKTPLPVVVGYSGHLYGPV